MVFTSLMVVLAFRNLPLADASAINFSAPAIVTVLAILFLKERVTLPRVASVLGGFLGILLIVRPGTEIFHSAALYAVAGAVAYAVYQILTIKVAGEDARMMLFYVASVGAIVMTAIWPVFGFPAHLLGKDLAAMIVVGWLATAGHFLFTLALQRAPGSGLASLTYIQLVFSTLLGWFIFNDVPDTLSFLGIAIIAASGAFLTWYERRHARMKIAEPAALD